MTDAELRIWSALKDIDRTLRVQTAYERARNRKIDERRWWWATMGYVFAWSVIWGVVCGFYNITGWQERVPVYIVGVLIYLYRFKTKDID